MEIPSQSAITADNVVLDIDGVLYIRVTDPYKSRYGCCTQSYAHVLTLTSQLRRRKCRICGQATGTDDDAF